MAARVVSSWVCRILYMECLYFRVQFVNCWFQDILNNILLSSVNFPVSTVMRSLYTRSFAQTRKCGINVFSNLIREMPLQRSWSGNRNKWSEKLCIKLNQTVILGGSKANDCFNVLEKYYSLLDLRFSQPWLWRVLSSEMWCSVIRSKFADVSEEFTASILRIGEKSKQRIIKT
jgi:hypothetical protein